MFTTFKNIIESDVWLKALTFFFEEKENTFDPEKHDLIWTWSIDQHEPTKEDFYKDINAFIDASDKTKIQRFVLTDDEKNTNDQTIYERIKSSISQQRKPEKLLVEWQPPPEKVNQPVNIIMPSYKNNYLVMLGSMFCWKKRMEGGDIYILFGLQSVVYHFYEGNIYRDKNILQWATVS